jgi:hypothetical protein
VRAVGLRDGSSAKAGGGEGTTPKHHFVTTTHFTSTKQLSYISAMDLGDEGSSPWGGMNYNSVSNRIPAEQCQMCLRSPARPTPQRSSRATLVRTAIQQFRSQLTKCRAQPPFQTEHKLRFQCIHSISLASGTRTPQASIWRPGNPPRSCRRPPRASRSSIASIRTRSPAIAPTEGASGVKELAPYNGDPVIINPRHDGFGKPGRRR